MRDLRCGVICNVIESKILLYPEIVIENPKSEIVDMKEMLHEFPSKTWFGSEIYLMPKGTLTLLTLFDAYYSFVSHTVIGVRN